MLQRLLKTALKVQYLSHPIFPLEFSDMKDGQHMLWTWRNIRQTLHWGLLPTGQFNDKAKQTHDSKQQIRGCKSSSTRQQPKSEKAKQWCSSYSPNVHFTIIYPPNPALMFRLTGTQTKAQLYGTMPSDALRETNYSWNSISGCWKLHVSSDDILKVFSQ